MHIALVYFPDVGLDTLDRIRRKYDPTFELIPPHVTVVHPVPGSVGKERLMEHFEAVLRLWRAFPIRLRGFEKSPDHWLFLKVQEGNVEFVQLFESLYTGPLAELRRTDLTYRPHVGLGLFVRKHVQYDMGAPPRAADLDETTYRQALKEAEAEQIDLRTKVSTLHFVELEDEILDWALGVRRELPSGARAHTTAQFDLTGGV